MSMYIPKEIREWFRGVSLETQQQLGSALCTLRNDLRGVEIQPDADLFGFLIRESGDSYTRWALWRRTDGKWSASLCIPDTYSGIDICDELPICVGQSINRAVNAIKADHKKSNAGMYLADGM